MYDSVKSTLLEIFCIAGRIRSRKQSLASGHLDLGVAVSPGRQRHLKAIIHDMDLERYF